MRGTVLFLSAVAAAALLSACGGNSAANNPAPQRAEEKLNEKLAQEMQAPIVADGPQRAKVHTELGMAYFNAGQIEIALSEAEIALEADRGNALAHNLHGLAQMALRQRDKADASFRQALSLAPANPEIANNYGWFLCQTGRIKESFTYFNLVYRNPLYKTPARVLHNMGVCALLDRNDADGESYLFRSLKLDPNNLRAHYLLADIDYRRGRFADAKEWLRKLHAKITPTSETIWLELRIDRKMGDRVGEARHASALRNRFRDTPEYQQMTRGEFD